MLVASDLYRYCLHCPANLCNLGRLIEVNALNKKYIYEKVFVNYSGNIFDSTGFFG